MLISYRADLEARLGEFWQRMSGSPSGLPRVYVGGVEQKELWVRIQKTASDLKIQLKIDDAESTQIVEDLVTAGRATGVHGVYPPHIQMLIDHLWKFSKVGKSTFTMEDYRQAGGVQGVIGNYLSRQLDYAHDADGHLRSVLVSLVRSYGVKAQKELAEVQVDTGLDAAKCEVALEKLIDLRLVRHVEAYYEITHDFVARKVVNELADSEEKEFKRFRELLSSKAAAYTTTQSALTAEELLMLYKHRQRIIPNDQELHLLLISFIHGTGPTLYWLLNTPPAIIAALLNAEEVGLGFTAEQQANVVLLRRKLGAKLFPDGDFSCFRDYQRSWELGRVISENSASLPAALLHFGLRHRREEVRDAALHAVAERIKKGESDSGLKVLLSRLDSWMRRCSGRFDKRSDYAKPLALAEAILRASRPEHLPELRRFVKSATLSPPMRPIVQALITHGSLSDFELILDKIASANEKVNF